MKKPTVFFSHSTQDQAALAQLKSLFMKKTGGAIDIFLSSDGQSIPLGRNWVHKLQEALDGATLLIAFATPSSVQSQWLYFEAGHAYAKGIRVVPVGFLGLDLNSLTPPLNLLQGFNISSEEGLDNLIALANEVFGHSHSPGFTVEEYQQIVATGASPATEVFGSYGPLVDEVNIKFGSDELNVSVSVAHSELKKLLQEGGIPYAEGNGTLDFVGVRARMQAGSQSPKYLQFECEPSTFQPVAELITRLAALVGKDGIKSASLRFDFSASVSAEGRSHIVSGRLSAVGATIVSNGRLRWKDLEFGVGHLQSFYGTTIQDGVAYLAINSIAPTISVAQIRALIEMLFERNVLSLAGRSQN